MAATYPPQTKREIGLDELKRLAGLQLEGIHQIQARVGVLLGFDAVGIGVIFTFGQSWLAGHLGFAIIAAVLLFTSASIFGAALMVEKYEVGPSYDSIVAAVKNDNTTVETFERWLIAKYAGQIYRNGKKIESNFRSVNLAIPVMLMGMAAIVLGALVP